MPRIRFLVGERKPARTILPSDAIARAQAYARGAREILAPARSIAELKSLLAPACRAYYTLAAVSRRRNISEDERDQLLRAIFPVRATLETAIEEKFRTIDDVVEVAVSGAFFGMSAKQGIGIRYALASCTPTMTCGGRCYAHDGRDRELHHLFRSVLNWHLGRRFEEGSDAVRQQILQELASAIAGAVVHARAEAKAAVASGFQRSPRIRFSHIGDMAATPTFTNALARAIRVKDPGVTCVVYTRHPWARRLDPDLFVINFSIDGDGDPRLRYAPPEARIVCSAWDGAAASGAEVNFLEHHVERVSIPSRGGTICPVTARHDEVASCDEAHCDVCFCETKRRATT